MPIIIDFNLAIIFNGLTVFLFLTVMNDFFNPDTLLTANSKYKE